MYKFKVNVLLLMLLCKISYVFPFDNLWEKYEYDNSWKVGVVDMSNIKDLNYKLSFDCFVNDTCSFRWSKIDSSGNIVQIGDEINKTGLYPIEINNDVSRIYYYRMGNITLVKDNPNFTVVKNSSLYYVLALTCIFIISIMRLKPVENQ